MFFSLKRYNKKSQLAKDAVRKLDCNAVLCFLALCFCRVSSLHVLRFRSILVLFNVTDRKRECETDPRRVSKEMHSELSGSAVPVKNMFQAWSIYPVFKMTNLFFRWLPKMKYSVSIKKKHIIRKFRSYKAMQSDVGRFIVINWWRLISWKIYMSWCSLHWTVFGYFRRWMILILP